MKSCVMKWSIIFLIIFLALFDESYAQSDFQFRSAETPKDFFSRGGSYYYYGYGGAYRISFNKKKVYSRRVFNYTQKAYNMPLLSRLFNGVDEVFYLDDGSIAFYKTAENYSCRYNHDANCLYSPIYIRKVSKKSLTGRISLNRIDKNIPLREKDTINFPLGSELYTIAVEIPAYEFSSFTDFDGLVCMKNEEDICKGVINNGKLDKVALFELNRVVRNNKEFLYKDADKSLIYHVDLSKNKLTPFDRNCLFSNLGHSSIGKCIVKSLPVGNITQHLHPKGFIYYQFVFNNLSVDNIVYWINNRGKPFKVFVNADFLYNFSLFNGTASLKIIEKLKSR